MFGGLRKNDAPSYEITRHYYTKKNLLEQSLDVYEPLSTLSTTSSSPSNNNVKIKRQYYPTIVLVMGSGWLGHVWWIYQATNWWNASGPRTIASLASSSSKYPQQQQQYRCISVRHSGGFFQVPNIWSMLGIVAVFVASILWYHHQYEYESSIERAVGIVVAPLMSIWLFLKWQGQGAASLDDMVQDAADALGYIRDDLGIQTPIVLGGYSSGAHVVACLLSSLEHRDQLDHLLLSKDEDDQHSCWILGVLYLSGVLSLESWLMNTVTLSLFRKWTTDLPSPLGSRHTPPPKHLLRKHLLVGCRQEVFGIPLLDATFCAEAYHEWLTQELRMQARCVLVDSNHWNVLSSRALAEALEEHLPWLLEDDKNAASLSNSNSKKSSSILLMERLESTASITSSDSSGTRTSS
jgi:hypothetical protein